MMATTLLRDTKAEDFATTGMKLAGGAVGSVVSTMEGNPDDVEYSEVSAALLYISSCNITRSRKLIEDHFNSVFNATGTQISMPQRRSA